MAKSGNVWVDIVHPHLLVLKKVLAQECFWSQMFKEQLVTSCEIDCIRHKETSPEDQVAYLIKEILPEKGETAYRRFRNVLRELPDQAWLLNHFPEQEPEAFVGSKVFQREDFTYDYDNDFVNSGGSANIFRATMVKSGKIVAAKVFFQEKRVPPEDVDCFKREAAILSQMNDGHPNVVQLIGMCATGHCCALLLEFFKDGDLYHLLHPIEGGVNPEVQKWNVRIGIATEIAAGMNYLHTNNPPILHLDLKPGNVLIKKTFNGFTCKITDFGLSKTRQVSTRHASAVKKRAEKNCGTIPYMAPERFDGNGSFIDLIQVHKKEVKLDVYSFGIILWELRELKIPYDGVNQQVIPAMAISGCGLPGSASCPRGYDQLQSKSTARDAFRRPFFKEMLSSLEQISRDIADNNFAEKRHMQMQRSDALRTMTLPIEDDSLFVRQPSLEMPDDCSMMSLIDNYPEATLRSAPFFEAHPGEHSSPSGFWLSSRARSKGDVDCGSSNVQRSGPEPSFTAATHGGLESIQDESQSSTGQSERNRSSIQQRPSSVHREVEVSSTLANLSTKATGVGDPSDCGSHIRPRFNKEISCPPSVVAGRGSTRLRSTKSEPATPVSCQSPIQKRRQSLARRTSVQPSSLFEVDGDAVGDSPLAQSPHSLSSVESETTCSLPSINDVDGMSQKELYRIQMGHFPNISSHDIKEGNLRGKIKDCLRDQLRDRLTCLPLDSVLSKREAGPFLETLDEQWKTFRDTIEKMKAFVASVGLANEIKENYAELQKQIKKQLPIVLITGSGSVGVTTLLNSLLGKEISTELALLALPCEVRFGRDKRSEIVETLNGKETVLNQISLDSENSVGNVREFLKLHGEVKKAKISNAAPTRKAVIYWPCRMLEHITLADVPDPKAYVAMEPRVSGYIFVLDGSSPHRDAVAKAKQLYCSICEHEDLPVAALFVLNKWDQFERDSPGEEKKEEYLRNVRQGIGDFAPAFKSNELLTISALKACCTTKAESKVTTDLTTLCETIKDSLSKWSEMFFLKAIRRYIWCQLWQTSETQHTKMCKLKCEASERSKLEKFPHQMEEKIKNLTDELVELLHKSDLNLPWNDLTEPEEEAKRNENLEKMVKLRLCRVICHSMPFRSFCEWIDEEAILVSQIDEAFDQLETSDPLLNAETLLPSAEMAVFEHTDLVVPKLFFDFFYSFMTKVDKSYRQVIDDIRNRPPTSLKRVLSNIIKVTVQPAVLAFRTTDSQDPGKKAAILSTWEMNKRKENETNKLANEIAKDMLSSPGMSEFGAGELVAAGSSKAESGNRIQDFFSKEISASNTAAIMADILLCRQLKHEHVLKFWGYGITSESGLSIKVLFKANGRKSLLADEIFFRESSSGDTAKKRYERVQVIAAQLLKAVQYLHSERKTLLCLNPYDVVVMVDDTLKVLPMIELPHWEDPLPLSAPYLAPEVVQKNCHDLLADMFSIGLILWEAWNQKSVYSQMQLGSHDSEESKKRAKIGKLVPPCEFSVDTELNEETASITSNCDADIILLKHNLGKLQRFVKQCWTYLASKRPTPQDGISTFSSVINNS
eukprot:m.81825 g.81825  ORF g.81825 m.81825 type:complete len:1564 (+) comp36263_c0_seq2:82-4773(+)